MFLKLHSSKLRNNNFFTKKRIFFFISYIHDTRSMKSSILYISIQILLVHLYINDRCSILQSVQSFHF